MPSSFPAESGNPEIIPTARWSGFPAFAGMTKLRGRSSIFQQRHRPNFPTERGRLRLVQTDFRDFFHLTRQWTRSILQIKEEAMKGRQTSKAGTDVGDGTVERCLRAGVTQAISPRAGKGYC